MGLSLEATRKKGVCLALLGATFWGASSVAAQFLFHEKHFTPEWLVVVRLLSSGLLLLLYDALKYRTGSFAIWRSVSDRGQLLLFAIFGMLSVQYTYFAAIRYGNAATATILQYLMPVIIVCYFALRYWRLPRLIEIVSVLLAVFGTLLLVTKGDFGHLALSPKALGFGVTSAFACAFYTVQPRRLLTRWRSPLVTGWAMFVGGACMSFYKPPWQFSGVWDSAAFGALAFVVLFGTIVAFCAYLESTKYISATQTSTIASVEPLASVLLSVWLLGTPFGLIDWGGMACILSTVFLLARAK